ncbi:START domain-containing protein [Fluviicoccus keumensis]|uniref:START domain-containing protein n=1 Tax=Fluviicoccus keumensis TaxID=1435465 RepID=A0A4Q7YHF6_9GAMM|nr:START domain-containing protein [Fluviicoccus keumensis]RZU36952.1 START domain-containing protein [Fluviicoccus keumensis]
MISRVTLLLCGLLACLSLPALAADDGELNDLRTELTSPQWQLVRNDELRHIKTYARLEEGKRLRSFRAEGLMDASLDAMARVYTDVDNMPRWYWETREAKLLKKVSDREYIYYMRFNAPLNLPDRDAVFRAVIEPYTAKRGYMQITVKALPDYLPPKEGLVRVVAQDLFAKFTPVGKDKVFFETEGYVDPGGKVPAWTINFVQKRVPYLIMVSLLRMAQNKEYAEASGPTAYTFRE